MSEAYFIQGPKGEIYIKLPSIYDISYFIAGKWRLYVKLEDVVIEELSLPLKDFVSKFLHRSSIRKVQEDREYAIIESIIDVNGVVRSLEMAEEIMSYEITFSKFEYESLKNKTKKFVYTPHEFDFCFWGFDEEFLFEKWKQAIGEKNPPKNEIVSTKRRGRQVSSSLYVLSWNKPRV